MSVVAIFLISSVFVLAAMVGLADALVHFVWWGVARLKETSAHGKPGQAPPQGITA